MGEFTNSAESREQQRRRRVDSKRALWDGRVAFKQGKDGIADNPFNGWNLLEKGQHTLQCLLWCRWLYGWLMEFHASPERR